MVSVDHAVHVYADGRGFVVVPALSSSVGAYVELEPVHRVSFVLGYATRVNLTKALRNSFESQVDGPVWDGDAGRWWAHNLLFVRLLAADEQLCCVEQRRMAEGWEDAAVNTLPGDVSFDDLAELLLQLFRAKLHA